MLHLSDAISRKRCKICVAVWSRFTGRADVQCCHGLSLRARRTVEVCDAWSRRTVVVCDAWCGRSVEFKLSVWAHVFFLCEGRMKVVKRSVRGSVMLPMDAASCLMWMAFRGSGNGESDCVLVEHSGDLPVVSWPFHLWHRRSWCNGSSCIELLWWQQLSGGGDHWSFVLSDGPSCLVRLVSDNGSDFCSVKLWLDSR